MPVRASHVLAGLAALIGGTVAGVAARRRRGATSTSSTSSTPRAPLTVPDVSALVRPEVFEGFPAWVQRFEGAIPTMYLDVKGYVTVGIGNLIDPIERALALPWLREDGRPATDDEIRADWQRVKKMAPNDGNPPLWAPKYKGPGAVHLDPADLAALVKRQSALDVRELARQFPDFPGYPANVQTALMGMAWALGAGFAPKWPTFSAAIRARDWKAAAESATSKDFTAARQKAQQELLLSAVEAA